MSGESLVLADLHVHLHQEAPGEWQHCSPHFGSCHEAGKDVCERLWVLSKLLDCVTWALLSDGTLPCLLFRFPLGRQCGYFLISIKDRGYVGPWETGPAILALCMEQLEAGDLVRRKHRLMVA